MEKVDFYSTGKEWENTNISNLWGFFFNILGEAEIHRIPKISEKYLKIQSSIFFTTLQIYSVWQCISSHKMKYSVEAVSFPGVGILRKLEVITKPK